MYERFTDRARKVMQLANRQVQRFNHEYIGTEHVLLGLFQEGGGTAIDVLKNLDVDLYKIRRDTEDLLRPEPNVVLWRRLPLTPRAKQVVAYAMEEAQNLNHDYVGTVHILLGLLREEEGVASQVLINQGLRLKRVRDEVVRVLDDSEPDERQEQCR